MTRPIRMTGRVCSALVATVAVALVVAPAAFAHATLVSSTPSNGAVLARAPKQVVLTFNEPVESALGSVRVYDSGLDRVDDGATTQARAERGRRRRAFGASARHVHGRLACHLG